MGHDNFWDRSRYHAHWPDESVSSLRAVGDAELSTVRLFQLSAMTSSRPSGGGDVVCARLTMPAYSC